MFNFLIVVLGLIDVACLGGNIGAALSPVLHKAPSLSPLRKGGVSAAVEKKAPAFSPPKPNPLRGGVGAASEKMDLFFGLPPPRTTSPRCFRQTGVPRT